jgi:hypothetical protein
LAKREGREERAQNGEASELNVLYLLPFVRATSGGSRHAWRRRRGKGTKQATKLPIVADKIAGNSLDYLLKKGAAKGGDKNGVSRSSKRRNKG